MSRFYRLVNPKFGAEAEWLAGTGGLYGSARWHTKGVRIVYLAPSRANALLEMAAQDSQLASYLVLEVEIPDAVSRETVDRAALPAGWEKRLAYPACQDIGMDWITRGDSALLVVPSALVVGDFNVLLNPLHAEAKLITAKQVAPQPMDERLIKHPPAP